MKFLRNIFFKNINTFGNKKHRNKLFSTVLVHLLFSQFSSSEPSAQLTSPSHRLAGRMHSEFLHLNSLCQHSLCTKNKNNEYKRN